jgi:hypothetical protein
LFFLDGAGLLRGVAGGDGEGPGEFLQLADITVGPADSLFVYDGRKRSVSVFDRDGVFGRSVRLGGVDTLGAAEYVGAVHNGELVGAFRQQTNGPGLVRDSLVLVAFTPGGEPRRALGVFPHLYVNWGPHSLPGQAQPMAFPVPVPFSPVTIVGVRDSLVLVAVPDPYTLTVSDLRGVRRITRQHAPAPPVADADRERLLEALGTGPARLREVEMLFHVEGPARLPAFGVEPLTAKVGEQHLLVTDAGGVWLRPFRLPGDTAARGWPRFGPDGVYEGTVTIPARFRPTAVRGDVVLGVYQDELDVESVRAYHLIVSE